MLIGILLTAGGISARSPVESLNGYFSILRIPEGPSWPGRVRQQKVMGIWWTKISIIRKGTAYKVVL